MPAKLRVSKMRNPLVTPEAVRLFERGLELQKLGAHEIDWETYEKTLDQEEYEAVERRLHWTLRRCRPTRYRGGPLCRRARRRRTKRHLSRVGAARSRTVAVADEGPKVLEMNSFAAGLKRIAKHARSGALGDDGAWLADGIEAHVAGAVPIDRALKAAWSSACRYRRDSTLRALAQLYLPPVSSPWSVACSLQSQIRRYETSAWLRDRELANMPPGYCETSREQLYTALRANADAGERGMPVSARQLVRILRHDPPLVMSNAWAECGDEQEIEHHEAENAGAPTERRRETGRA
jgi:hypothetical protein